MSIEKKNDFILSVLFIFVCDQYAETEQRKGKHKQNEKYAEKLKRTIKWFKNVLNGIEIINISFDSSLRPFSNLKSVIRFISSLYPKFLNFFDFILPKT